MFSICGKFAPLTIYNIYERTSTILYVDDDTDDLLLISDAFEKYTDHLTVLHAHNCHNKDGKFFAPCRQYDNTSTDTDQSQRIQGELHY